MPVTNPKEPKPAKPASSHSTPWQIPTLIVFLAMMALTHLAAAIFVAPAYLLAVAFEALLIFGVWQRSRTAWTILAVVGGIQALGLVYVFASGQLTSIGVLFTLVIQLMFLAVLALAYPAFFTGNKPAAGKSVTA